MSLKTVDRHFTGAIQGGNYEFYLQLVNQENGYWVQGTRYKDVMDVYGTLATPPKTKTPDKDYYDTREYILLTDYQKHLGSVTWSEEKQQWEGTLTIGELTIKKRGSGPFGWPTHKQVFTEPWDGSTFSVGLHGLLDCGAPRPMRIFQVGSKPYSTNAYLMQAEPHSMGDIADRFNVTSATNFNDGIGSYTVHYVIHLADADAPTFGGATYFGGFAGLQYDETTTYNRRTLQSITSNKQWTVLYNESDEQPATFGVHWTKFHNRRRYHLTPEEEWFHTSSNPHFAYSITALNGMTEFELGGDIELVGCPVVDLPWGVQGIDGGNTFETQLDYDWVLPTTGPGASYPRPDGVTKYINVRRWKWKNLEVNVPRIKLQITTPEGSANTVWVGPNTTTFTDYAENGLGGAGQAWPADDVPPDYPGQGSAGTGRVPDLTVYPFSYMPTPDSGVSDYQINNMFLSLTGGTQTLTRSGSSPDYYKNHTITIIDDTKKGGWNPTITKLDSASKTHNQDRYIRNGWLTTSPRFMWGWPESMSVNVSGVSSVMDGSHTLPLLLAGASYNSTQVFGSGSGVSYGKSYYGVPAGGILFAKLFVSSGIWYFYIGVNGPSDPLVGRSQATVQLIGKVNFLGPISLQVVGKPGALVTLVPS